MVESGKIFVVFARGTQHHGMSCTISGSETVTNRRANLITNKGINSTKMTMKISLDGG
jgi:hypothetical protein